MNYVTVRTYDGKMARVPENQSMEFIKTQNRIRFELDSGRQLNEIMTEINNERRNKKTAR